MTVIYSADGSTVTRRFAEPPKRHWIQDTATAGHFEPADVAHGYFPLIEPPRPSDDHVATFARDGDTFTIVWTFNQALADARAAEAAQTVARRAAHKALPTLATYLATPNPNAAQSLAMVPILAQVVQTLLNETGTSPLPDTSSPSRAPGRG